MSFQLHRAGLGHPQEGKEKAGEAEKSATSTTSPGSQVCDLDITYARQAAPCSWMWHTISGIAA